MLGSNDLFSFNSFNKCLKCPEPATAVGYSLTINLPEVLFFTLSIFLSYISFGMSASSSIGTFNRFAAILSASFSSAISNVMYRTLFPSIRFAAAIWHIASDLPTPVPAKIIASDFLGSPPLVILFMYSKSKGTRSSTR